MRCQCECILCELSALMHNAPCAMLYQTSPSIRNNYCLTLWSLHFARFPLINVLSSLAHSNALTMCILRLNPPCTYHCIHMRAIIDANNNCCRDATIYILTNKMTELMTCWWEMWKIWVAPVRRRSRCFAPVEQHLCQFDANAVMWSASR